MTVFSYLKHLINKYMDFLLSSLICSESTSTKNIKRKRWKRYIELSRKLIWTVITKMLSWSKATEGSDSKIEEYRESNSFYKKRKTSLNNHPVTSKLGLAASFSVLLNCPKFTEIPYILNSLLLIAMKNLIKCKL